MEVHSCSIRREIEEIWTDSTAFAVDQFLRRRLLGEAGRIARGHDRTSRCRLTAWYSTLRVEFAPLQDGQRVDRESFHDLIQFQVLVVAVRPPVVARPHEQ